MKPLEIAGVLGVQEVPGSNPGGPTNLFDSLSKNRLVLRIPLLAILVFNNVEAKLVGPRKRAESLRKASQPPAASRLQEGCRRGY